MEENVEKEILERAIPMFHRYGLRAVTMDDIARDLAMSKKTLYKYFSNKEALVKKGVERIFIEVSTRMKQLLDYPGNAIDMLFAMDELICHNIETHDPSMEFQLERYYPEVSAELEKKKRKIILTMMTENLRRGIAEGHYRKELDVEVVSLLYYSRARLMTQDGEELFGSRPLEEIIREILIYHIRGVASAEGLAYLEKKLMNSPLKK